MFQGFTLGRHVKLVEYTGQLLRKGKASMSAHLADIFERLGCSDESWKTRMLKLTADGQPGTLSGSLTAAIGRFYYFFGNLQVKE
jgi:hypothetical protein